MEQVAERQKIIAQLQRDILSMQGLRDATVEKKHLGLDVLEHAFPDKSFPVAAVHEFLSYSREEAAATNSFISCLLNKLMHKDGHCIWVSVRNAILSARLKTFRDRCQPHYLY